MGTTPRGFPYPEPSDPINAGAGAIKTLAEKADQLTARVAGGFATVSTAASSASGTVAIVFPVGLFTAAPKVSVTSQNGNWWGFISTAPTAAGFTAGAASYATRAASSVPIAWTAIQ